MSTIFIIHGAYGYPEENWFPWMKQELEKLGYDVFVPKLPTPEGQSLVNWLETFDEYMPNIDEDTILVGHSTGVAFILSVLEKINKPINCAFFVAGFIDLIGNGFDDLIKTFVKKEFDWKTIKQNCGKFFVFQSDNDPYVKLERAEELAEKLGVDVILVKDAGHFNEPAGYTEFRLLLDKITEEL